MTIRAPAVGSFRQIQFALFGFVALAAIHLAVPATAQSTAPPPSEI